MSWKNKMKHFLQYKESCVISKISNLAIISSKLWKHYFIIILYSIYQKWQKFAQTKIPYTV